MRILLTGGTGLVGRALCQFWRSQGHELWVLSRDPSLVSALCSGARGVAELAALDQIELDAVVNLAGAPIADRPWTDSRRQVLWQSRIDLTRALVDWMARQASPPRVLLSASAVGWYGDRGEATLDEHAPPGGADFGSRLCVAWEHEAGRAKQLGVRVACLRIAPVLSAQGGMLARLKPVYKLGMGGRLGNGRQWMPWVHIDDLVRWIDHLLLADDGTGAFNACAPNPVRNADFTRILARTWQRPAFLPAPAAVLRLLLGEMSVLLLGSQRVIPTRMQAAAFSWQYPTLEQAVSHLYDHQERGTR